MSNIVKFSKIVSSLPGTLEADTLYLVRLGDGFDFYTTNSSGTIVPYKINPSQTWSYLAINWSVEPTLNTTITDGEVYNYTLGGVTRYRFVPTTYDPTQDAFYANFDGTNLTNLITKRG